MPAWRWSYPDSWASRSNILSKSAAHRLRPLHLLDRLNTLRRPRPFRATAPGRGSSIRSRAVLLLRDSLDERAVDLQRIEWIAVEMMQRTVAGAKVIHVQAYAQRVCRSCMLSSAASALLIRLLSVTSSRKSSGRHRCLRQDFRHMTGQSRTPNAWRKDSRLPSGRAVAPAASRNRCSHSP